jgi:hypothetical protein
MISSTDHESFQGSRFLAGLPGESQYQKAIGRTGGKGLDAIGHD